MKCCKNQNGMSMVQVVIAMGLTGLIAVSMMKMFDQSQKAQNTSLQNFESLQLMQRVEATLRHKAACQSSFGGNPISVNPTQIVHWNGTTEILKVGEVYSGGGMGGSVRVTSMNFENLQTDGVLFTYDNGGVSTPAISGLVDLKITFSRQTSIDPNAQNKSFGANDMIKTIKGLNVILENDVNGNILGCFSPEDSVMASMCTSLGGIWVAGSATCNNFASMNITALNTENIINNQLIRTLNLDVLNKATIQDLEVTGNTNFANGLQFPSACNNIVQGGNGSIEINNCGPWPNRLTVNTNGGMHLLGQLEISDIIRTARGRFHLGQNTDANHVMFSNELGHLSILPQARKVELMHGTTLDFTGNGNPLTQRSINGVDYINFQNPGAATIRNVRRLIIGTNPNTYDIFYDSGPGASLNIRPNNGTGLRVQTGGLRLSGGDSGTLDVDGKMSLFKMGVDHDIRGNIDLGGKLKASLIDTRGSVHIGGLAGPGPAANLTVEGSVTVGGSVVHASDERLKKDILKIVDPLERLLKISGYTYEWIDPDKANHRQIGLLAQEVQKEFPELVKENKKGYLSVNYSGLIPPMIEAIKEQNNKIQELENKLEEILKLIKKKEDKS